MAEEYRLAVLADMLHEIAHTQKNLLNSAAGFCELALRALPDDHPAHECVADALSAARRAVAIAVWVDAWALNKQLIGGWGEEQEKQAGQ